MNLGNKDSKEGSLSYRPDVDGLRAIAVIGVLFFHFFPNKVPGGFIGVDVFFVISGFLISSIIIKSIANNKFSYLNFCIRRVKRIFPALLIILLITLIISFIFLLPTEFEVLMKEVWAGALFSFNLLMSKEVGYFNEAAEKKQLLHLWSLGIEEQFYILWPFILIFTTRLKKYFLLSLYILMIFSFILNLIFIHQYPTMTFYLPFTRFWELMAGGILGISFVNKKTEHFFGVIDLKKRNWLAILGVVIVLLSFKFFKGTYLFPGWIAVIPVIGTLLIIGSGRDTWINQKILSHKFFVSIGLISYPLYLCHWPLLIWFKYYEKNFGITHLGLLKNVGREINVYKLLLMILSFLLATLIYKVWENKFRFAPNTSKRIIALFISVVVFIPLMASGLNTFLRNESHANGSYAFLKKYDFSYSENEYHSKTIAGFRQDCSFYGRNGELKDSIDNSCFGEIPSANQKILIWGDSYVQHLRYGLDYTLGIHSTLSPKISVAQITSASCPASTDMADGQTNGILACNNSNEKALKYLKDQKPQVVILAQASSYLETNWDKLINEITSSGVKKIIVIGPVPRWRDDLSKVIANYYWPNPPERLQKHLQDIPFEEDKKLRKIFSSYPSVYYLSAIDAFCKNEKNDFVGCIATFNNPFDLESFDSGHMTSIASKYFAKKDLTPLVLSLLSSK
ncbi:MAG: acyltransferase [Bacteriovorax sp.]|nr:acyltransferase [Bacteriovorax sp.]